MKKKSKKLWYVYEMDNDAELSINFGNPKGHFDSGGCEGIDKVVFLTRDDDNLTDEEIEEQQEIINKSKPGDDEGEFTQKELDQYKALNKFFKMIKGEVKTFAQQLCDKLNSK